QCNHPLGCIPMASITIRQLDEDLKKRLRLRAATHGRSMEDEVRTILRGAAGTEPQAERDRAPATPAQPITGRAPARTGSGRVAPATADLMAKMANGHADDLATAVLLATGKPILIAPAMNPAMWSNKATRRNLARLVEDGVAVIGPNAGEMAESGEAGVGRMAE